MGNLQTILDVEGFNDITSLLEDCEFGTRAGVPAVCTNKDCDYVEDFEPDARDYPCPECGTKTMQSAYVLMGVM